MPLVKIDTLDEAGLRTLVSEIFKVIENNYIRRSSLDHELIESIKKNIKFTIKDEDGCLYLVVDDPSVEDP